MVNGLPGKTLVSQRIPSSEINYSNVKASDFENKVNLIKIDSRFPAKNNKSSNLAQLPTSSLKSKNVDTVNISFNNGNFTAYVENKLINGADKRGYMWAFVGKNKFGEEYSATGWTALQGAFSKSNTLPTTFIGKQLAKAKSSSEQNSISNANNAKNKDKIIPINAKSKSPVITLYSQPKLSLPTNDTIPYNNMNMGGLITGNNQNTVSALQVSVGRNNSNPVFDFAGNLLRKVWDEGKKTFPSISGVLEAIRDPNFGLPSETHALKGIEMTKAEKEIISKPASGNDLGSISSDSKAEDTKTFSRLRRDVDKSGKFLSYSLVAQLKVKENKLISAKYSELVLKDNSGKTITDLKKARLQAKDFLNSGATMLTFDQAAYSENYKYRREQSMANLPRKTEFKSALVDLPESKSSDKIKRLKATKLNQSAPGHSRTSFFHSWHSETSDQTCRANAMLVPNVVIQAPLITKWTFNKDITKIPTVPNVYKKNAIDNFSNAVTVQPATLFFPVTCPANKVPGLSSLPDATQTTSGKSLIHATYHYAGFYPGDRGSNKDTGDNSTIFSKLPFSSEPKFRTIDTFSNVTNTFTDQNQTYINISDGSSPAKIVATGSFNNRIIGKREEHLLPLWYESWIGQDNLKSTKTSYAPYTWIQTQVSAGVGKAAASVKVGYQIEYGGYVENYGTQLAPRFGKGKKEVTDWHIVNGKITEGRDAWNKQFSKIEKKTGIVFRSQSVVKSENDNVAPVYLKTPNIALNFGNKTPNAIRSVAGDKQQRTIKDSAYFRTVGKADNNPDNFFDFLSGKRPDAISANALVASFRELSKRFPEYAEFKVIDAETLIKLNSRKMVEFIDPTTGEKAKGFKLGDWINTGLSTSLGGPGLYAAPGNPIK